MGLRELLILLLILAIVGVILRGLYVALRARRGQLRMALDKNIPQYDPDELLSSELPNGGARLVQRSFDEVLRRNSEYTSRDQTIPVLMDTVGEDEPLDAAPRQSSVATARNAARQKHGMRTAIKPVHRPIDRMAAVAAAAQAASPAVMSAPAPDTHATEYFDDDLDDDDLDDDLDDDDDYDDDDEHDQYDDADRDDDAAEDNEADDSEDPEDFESWEEDQDGEDDEYEAEDFDSVHGDDNTDEPGQDVRASGCPSVEEKASSSADTWYEDEAVPPVDDLKSGPRRWLQWAGEKFSGKGTTAHDPSGHVSESQERAHRAEPVLGLGSFDDQEAVSAPRNVQAPVRKAREPLDKSRQKELSLDHPDDDILFDRAERAAEKREREDKPEQTTPAVQQVRGQGPREAVPAASSAPAQDLSEVLVLNVVARPDHEIAGVDLLQVLLANQLRFGDMAIFHWHVDGAARSPVLFSVANLVNPGTFDLNRISEFSTRGVCFFMTLPSVGNNMQAFDKMLEAAQQVRIALDADLKDDNRSVMTAQTIEHYRQRVRDFDLRQLRQPK